ncbi:MAG: threonine--tRNA ligase [Candidatus Paceibacterota bacterium]
MTEDSIGKIRHSLAHVLALAVRKHDPEVKIAIGPSTDVGFYYDFEFSEGKGVGEENLKKLEKEMRNILKRGFTPEYKEISANAARAIFKDQPYKLELIEEIATLGKQITTYTVADFTDLCEGPHVADSKEIKPDAFTLSHVAGAYWRGSEKNTMLTRIYGVAFETKEDLETYQLQMEEAKKRDHRKLGKELDLFTFSNLVGSGLPLWTPKGTIIRKELDAYVQELRKKYNYQTVTVPHFTKKDLYEKSGHWDKFTDELFRVHTREGKEFAVKPMNCPHHTQIFDRQPHSYRDMPQRYAETTMVYRDEQSGELGGLTRVLSITQDDSHVFCRDAQVKEEFFSIWDIVDTFYKTFGFKLRVRLSFHDPEEFEKHLGTKEVWENAENALREIAQSRGADYFEAKGEAALYGPKIDFMAMDSIGREHQVATIQLDMNLPERFDLTCTNEKGDPERIVMIHCAVMGSLERFSAVLIEHFAGKFPLWLSPVQVSVLPIGDTHSEYAQKVTELLKAQNIRAELDTSAETLGKKIRNVKLNKTPYFLVIGDEEVTKDEVTLESRDNGKIGSMSVETLTEKILKEVAGKI